MSKRSNFKDKTTQIYYNVKLSQLDTSTSTIVHNNASQDNQKENKYSVEQ